MVKSIGQIFWGWYVVLGAFLFLFFSNGIRYSFGVFVFPMFEEYGWPMSVISAAASVNLLVYSIGGIACGRLADVIAPKWIMTTGSMLTAAGLYLLTRAETPAGLYLSYGILCGFGQACIGAVVCIAAVGKWFVRRRGFAIGLATMGIGVGTVVLSPVAGYIVSLYGWRAGFVFFGGLILAVGILISQMLMGRTTPEASGLLPDGETTARQEPRRDSTPALTMRSPMKPVLTDVRFWVLTLCGGLALVTVMMTFVHQVAYAVGKNIGPFEAAAALGIVGFAGSAGKVSFGWFCDRIPDAKYAAALGFLIMAVGMALLITADTAVALYLFAVVYGFGYGSMGPVIPYLIIDRFGPQVLGSAYGVHLFFASGVGGSLGPLIGGFIYDRTGSYLYAWLLNLLLLTVISVLILALKPRRAIGTAR